MKETKTKKTSVGLAFAVLAVITLLLLFLVIALVGTDTQRKIWSPEQGKEKTKEELAIEEQAIALYHGQKPWTGYVRDVYGDEAQIIINTANASAIGVIKDRDGIATHAYIEENSQYIFNLPAGEYQTFFYFGENWLPYKTMLSGVQGGFRDNGVVSKDEQWAMLDIGSSLTYTLKRVQNGNFSTSRSSEVELFN